MRSHGLKLPAVLLVSAAVLAGMLFMNGQKTKKAARRAPAAILPAEKADDPSDQKLQKFSLSGFDEKGERFWKLEGETAKIDPGQTVYLEQNVTLRLKDDTVIRTDRVQWSQDRSTLTTEAHVDVKHQRAVITGEGALGRPNENFVQLNKKVKMVIDGSTTVTCTGPMKLYYNENRMTFLQNVKVVDGRGTLTARRMDVFFSGETKDVERITAIGDVVIERGTDTTHSRRAIYTPATGSLRLEGNPEITLHKTRGGLL